MIMAELADDKLKSEGKALPPIIYRQLAGLAPELADMDESAGIADDGLRLNTGAGTDLRFASESSGRPGQHPESSGRLQLIFSELTFGTEALSIHSECLSELEPEPAVLMHPCEAEGLDLIDGDLVSIQTEIGRLEAQLKVVDNMAAGVLIIPRQRNLSWQIFETGATSIGREQIKKVIT
jgi:anaerobic selenocysteine-containing dehydrogenase